MATKTHFYPRPPRGRRRRGLAQGLRRVQISIHALREEGDRSRRVAASGCKGISIHALREEGDGMGHVVIAAAE